mmetsp:Transcript_151435/g.278171  ORF Transcript_151435/g.278171 Transcript_151435/m.278171 type:complete len:211 (-) Transcript_151435:1016-1648(-)
MNLALLEQHAFGYLHTSTTVVVVLLGGVFCVLRPQPAPFASLHVDSRAFLSDPEVTGEAVGAVVAASSIENLIILAPDPDLESLSAWHVLERCFACGVRKFLGLVCSTSIWMVGSCRRVLIQPAVLVVAVATIIACLAEPEEAVHVFVASFRTMRIPFIIVLTTNPRGCNVRTAMILELGLENIQLTGPASLETSTPGSTAPGIALWYLP